MIPGWSTIPIVWHKLYNSLSTSAYIHIFIRLTWQEIQWDVHVDNLQESSNTPQAEIDICLEQLEAYHATEWFDRWHRSQCCCWRKCFLGFRLDEKACQKIDTKKSCTKDTKCPALSSSITTYMIFFVTYHDTPKVSFKRVMTKGNISPPRPPLLITMPMAVVRRRLNHSGTVLEITYQEKVRVKHLHAWSFHCVRKLPERRWSSQGQNKDFVTNRDAIPM